MRRILVLSPHIDDGILGAGGALHHFMLQGDEVHYVALSLSSTSIPTPVALNEVDASIRSLGISALKTYRFPTRDFPRNRQSLLDSLIQLRDRIKPDLVLTPSTFDIHQDHKVTTEEAIRAFKYYMLLGYELPWNNMQFRIGGQIALEKDSVDAKVTALECFTSQKDRPYIDPEFIRGWARMRGVQRGVDYAEVFEVIRWNVK